MLGPAHVPCPVQSSSQVTSAQVSPANPMKHWQVSTSDPPERQYPEPEQLDRDSQTGVVSLVDIDERGSNSVLAVMFNPLRTGSSDPNPYPVISSDSTAYTRAPDGNGLMEDCKTATSWKPCKTPNVAGRWKNPHLELIVFQRKIDAACKFERRGKNIDAFGVDHEQVLDVGGVRGQASNFLSTRYEDGRRRGARRFQRRERVSVAVLACEQDPIWI